MKTLLEKAKEVKGSRNICKITKEQIDLALAWARGEINYTQASIANGGDGKKSSAIYILLARGLREYIQENNL